MEKFRSTLLKNKTFPLLTALLCAAAFAGGHMFVKYGYGLFNEIAQAEMVRNGLETETLRHLSDTAPDSFLPE